MLTTGSVMQTASFSPVYDFFELSLRKTSLRTFSFYPSAFADLLICSVYRYRYRYDEFLATADTAAVNPNSESFGVRDHTPIQYDRFH